MLAAWVKKNFVELPISNIDGKELVIIATGDFDGEYGYGSSDLESWGIDKDGRLFWAYASGCSCNCGAGTEEKSFKAFEIDNQQKNVKIQEALSMFNNDPDKFRKSLQAYEYKSY